MKITSIKLLTLIFLVSISISNWNCGLVSDVIDGDDNPAQYAIYPDNYTVSPFETITLTIEGYVFTEESYYGEIYDKEIELAVVSDNMLIFMMPYIPEGEQSLEIVLEGVTHDIWFTIMPLEEIQNPDAIITEYSNNVNEAFNELKNMNQLYNLEVEPQNIQVIENYFNDFNHLYSSATAEEKQELAQFMNANPELFDFSNFDYSFFSDSLNTRDFVNWDKRLTEDMRYFTGLVIATGATVVLFNGALTSLNPFFIGITGAALLTEVVLLKQHTKAMLNRSYKPFEFDVSNELRSNKVEFENDVDYQLGIDATYRTLYKNDQNSSEVTIELVANINKVTNYWNQVLEHIPGTSGSVSNLADQESYVVNSHSSSVTPEYISIDNISNSNVQMVSFSTNNNMVVVKFKTNAEEDQDFNFDIVYNNPDFSEDRITVDAYISVIEPFYLTGHWHLTWYTNDSRTEATQIDLIDFQTGPPLVGEPIWYYYVSSGETHSAVGTPATWNQSFSSNTSIYGSPYVSLTNNYWGNILLRFVYDEENPNRLIGESIGLSNNGFNLELTKQ